MRRSRDRFWRAGADASSDDGAFRDEDKLDAYDTLHTVLEILCRVAAPFLPYLTETVYRDLTGERSVHLQSWPDPAELPDDPDLVATMDLVRDVASAGHSIRKGAGRRARLPLRRLTVAAPGAPRLEHFRGLLADELNVKKIDLVESIGPGQAEEVLGVVPAVLGPRLGADTQKVIKAVRVGEWARNTAGEIEAAGVHLNEGEYTLRLRPIDETASRVLPGDAGVVTLELETDEGSRPKVSRVISSGWCSRHGGTPVSTSRTGSISPSRL